MKPFSSLGKNYKYLFELCLLNVFFVLVCVPTAGKMIDFFGTPISIAIYYFPFVYILSDVTTEVYGYAASRKILWYSIIAQVAMMLFFQAVAMAPPAVSFENNDAFILIFNQVPRIVFFGIIATFLGDITNNYILSKMKVMTEGKGMAMRFVASTIGGEFVNTAVFFFFGLGNILPTDVILNSILVATGIKIVVEIVMLPVSIWLANKLKKVENVDVFDYKEDFNPLKI